MYEKYVWSKFSITSVHLFLQVNPEGCPFPAYLQNLTVGKIEQYQV